MPKFRKKAVVVEATQWFKNGDHPNDQCQILDPGNGPQSEGKVVRYCRNPEVPGTTVCKRCSLTMHHHGWIDTLEGGHNVCPGDWIITGVKNEHYPCKPDIFDLTYEPVIDQIDIHAIKLIAQRREKQFLACLGLHHGFVDVEDNLEQQMYKIKLFDPNGNPLGILFVKYDQVNKFVEEFNGISN